jgi:hypothetical protein
MKPRFWRGAANQLFYAVSGSGATGNYTERIETDQLENGEQGVCPRGKCCEVGV